jgi:carboxyl-terminal processing protease
MKFLRTGSLNFVRSVIIFSFVFSLVFLSGYWLGVKGYTAQMQSFPKAIITRSKPPSKEYVNFDLFWKVWDILESRYYDKKRIVEGKMVYGAIQGMVSAIGDPYTAFLPPDDNKLVQEDLKGNFDGIGIQIGYIGSQLAVIAPLPGSPAEEAGIKAGDLIVAIKDEAKNVDTGTFGMSIPDAVGIIRGTAGTRIKLTLLREGVTDPIEVEVTRRTIEVPSVRLSFLPLDKGGDDKSLAYIKVMKFGGETLEEWNKAVEGVLLEKETKMIVVDVRNNPGGYLQGAVDLASDFLETGDVVVIEEDSRGTKEESKVTKIGRLRNYKTVVLINKGSASASEIFAGALRDNKKVKLIGETSFGKGTIQEPQQVNGGSALHITIARWLTPSGYWVDGKGLEPDVLVRDDENTSDDEQLIKAIEQVKML